MGHIAQGPRALRRGIFDTTYVRGEKTPPVRIELKNPCGVPLQIGAASPYPALSVVVVAEGLGVDDLRNKVV